MLFRKKVVDGNLSKDKVAMKVVNLLLKLQVKFSNVMGERAKNISAKRLKVWLAVFCLLSGGSSVYLFAEAIFKDEQPALKIEKIVVPKYYDQDLQTGGTIDPKSYEGLQSFRRFMDSVQKVKFRDSILKIR